MDVEQLEEYVNEFVKTQEALSELCPELERADLQIMVSWLHG